MCVHSKGFLGKLGDFAEPYYNMDCMSETEKKPVFGAEFFTTASNLLILNLLWLFTSIPLITVADAAASMYHVMLKLERGTEDSVVKPYFRFFIKNFLKSLPYTLLFWMALIGIFSAFFLFGGGASALALGLAAALSLIAVTLFGWVIPLFAQFDNTVGAMFSNAFNLALQNPSVTGKIAAGNWFLFLLFLFMPGLFGYVLYLWFVILHAVICRYLCRALLPVFRELMPETEPEPEEEITEDAE